MKIKLKLLSVILFIFLNQSFVLAQEKIMFLDVDYIFSKSNLGKDIRQQIDNKAKNLNIEKKKYKISIDKEKKEIFTKKNIISNDDYKNKISILENKIKDINDKVSKKNKSFLEFKRNAELQFSKKLTEILQEYVNDNNIQMIVNKKNILIGKSEFDTTPDILSLLDKKVKKLKIK